MGRRRGYVVPLPAAEVVRNIRTTGATIARVGGGGDQTARMRSLRTRRSAPVLLAGGALALAACGGGDGGDESLPTADAGAETQADANADGGSAEADSGPVPVAELLPTQVDLVGETVRPESEIESNLLPPVVLDDITTGRKVNFRNLIPQDKPVLLWMYAPH